MKVQVTVTGPGAQAKAAAYQEVLELVVSPADTVSSVKARVAAANPDLDVCVRQELSLGGQKLDDGLKFADCGIKEGSSLGFAASYSEQALAQQLEELLQTRALSTEELGLMFCHKYGLTVSAALMLLGHAEQLPDFLRREGKRFALEGGRVSAAARATAPAPAASPAAEALKSIPEDLSPILAVTVAVVLKAESRPDETSRLDLTARSDERVEGVKARLARAELIPFPCQQLFLGEEELGEGRSLAEFGVRDGSALTFVARASEQVLQEQLRGFLQRPLSTNELATLYCYKYGTPVTRALKLLGKPGKLKDYLEVCPGVSIHNGCVTLEATRGHCRQDPTAGQALAKVAELITKTLFLNVHSVATRPRGGGGRREEVVFYLSGLPPIAPKKWRPGVLSSVAAALQAAGAAPALTGVRVAGDLVEVLANGTLHVDLRFKRAAREVSLAA